MPKLAPKNPEQRAWLKPRNKYVSGFCNDINKPAQCEGTKPKTWRGSPMPTCEFIDTCPCSCHWSVDQMFVMTGLERKLIPNPEYQPPKSDFLMPVFADNPLGEAAVTGDGVIGPLGDQEPVAHVPTAPTAAPTAPLAVRRTETGRAARGGLEAQVWDACRNLDADPLTPKVIGEWIAEKYKIPTPSSGAINAVWDRWTKLGFCEQAKKPNRFLKFSGDGSWEELARMKGSVKRQEKSSKFTIRRK